MGATTWSYFAPYQDDPQEVLDILRKRVFDERKYEDPGLFDLAEHERRLDFLKDLYEKLPLGERREKSLQFVEDARQAGVKMAKRKKPRAAKSIKALLRRCGESGTHSIIDIERVSSTPTLGTVAPLSPHQLVKYFGTEQPTHSMVEEWSQRIEQRVSERAYDRWQGIYVLVYELSKPVEIYFEGCSGD